MICTNLPPVIELVVWWREDDPYQVSMYCLDFTLAFSAVAYAEREKSGNHLAGGTDMPVFTFPWTPTEDWAFTYRSMSEARWDAFDRRVLN